MSVVWVSRQRFGESRRSLRYGQPIFGNKIDAEIEG